LALAVLFLIPALSLAGLPPLSGFWAKLTIIQAGVEQSQFVIVAIALGVGMLTLYSMIKIWNEVFWKAKPDQVTEVDSNQPSRWNWVFYISPIVVLALFTLIIGLVAEPFFQLAQQTAAQLLDPTQYIETVLGGGL
jgi:multicomponent Na+:H+ antiporter subunit D